MSLRKAITLTVEKIDAHIDGICQILRPAKKLTVAMGLDTKMTRQFQHLTFSSVFIMLTAGYGYAETRLICENPRREYLVIYSPGAPALILNPDSDTTKYPVLVDDNADGSHVITASTPNAGPTARLHLRPYTKLEFWSGGQVVQTDGCYTDR